MIIERFRGDTVPDEFTITVKRTDEIADLTDTSFILTVDSRKDPADTSTQLYQLTGVVDVDNGTVSFSPTAAQADLVGYYYFDVQMTEATGKKRTLVLDSYIYKQDITK